MASGATYFGVGEVILILMLLVFLKYCCKKMKIARRSELEQSIRSATSAPACGPTFASPPVRMPRTLVTFETPDNRTIQFTRQPIGTNLSEPSNVPSY